MVEVSYPFLVDEELENIKHPPDMFCYFWKKKFFTKESMNRMIDVMEAIEKYDIIKLMIEYHISTHRTVEW